MATHGMIDLETLDTTPNATILTLGAVKFNPYNSQTPHTDLYLKVDVDVQTKMGRIVNDSTIEWWGQQNKEVREDAFAEQGRISLEELTKTLNKWCVGLDELWCQGPLFDYAILQNLYAQLEKPVPWAYWQIRDSRTVLNMLPKDMRKGPRTDVHNAFADCKYQARAIQKAYRYFGVQK